MSHNIHIDQFGKASFASAREIAWHGLGQVVDGAMTSEDALEFAGLNYEVEKAPAHIFVTGDDGLPIQVDVPDTFATYRTDTNQAFGPVGKRYTIVQNAEAFDFFDAIVGKGEAIYETAGALGNGETVFITAKLPGYINVPGEDIEKYLLLKTTHDGTESIVGGFTPVRVVCNNTLNWAISQGLSNQVKIRHTASANDKLREAAKLMGIVNQLTEELGEVFTIMKRKPIVDEDVQKLFEQLILTKDEIEERVDVGTQKANTLRDMYRFYNEGVGQEYIIGTQFGAYNAVSGYYQNVKASTNPESLLKSNLFGNNANIVRKSLALLTDA